MDDVTLFFSTQRLPLLKPLLVRELTILQGPLLDPWAVPMGSLGGNPKSWGYANI